jgi:hypothetical protein
MKNNQSPIYNCQLRISLTVFIFGLFFFQQTASAYQVGINQIVLNDPGYTQNANDIDKSWGLVKTETLPVWEKNTGSKGVVVAIIDTGIDATHEDLQSINFVEGFDVLNRKLIAGKINSDDNGHGTLIAGVIGATPNNLVGISGVVWQVSIMPIKALDANGKGDTAKISEAIIWAVDHGAQIINLSVGGIGFGRDKILSEAITYAYRKNVVIVAAVGNDSTTSAVNLDEQPVYPACEDNGENMVIGVSAIDQNDLKPEFANFGKNCVDVVAPGKRILSTINHDPVNRKYSPNAYAYASGSSLATPFVAGQAVLLKSAFPFATNAQIRDRILTTADKVDMLNLSQCLGRICLGLLGQGRINVKKSLDTQILQSNFLDGDLLRSTLTGNVYFYTSGKKMLVSSFVYNQRFLGLFVKNISEEQIASLPDGSYALPAENTLVKAEKDKTVYLIKNNMKQPISAKVFRQRKFQTANIQVVSFAELNSWILGNFLPPTEGTIVKNPNGKQLFWTLNETLRPINKQFIKERGLNGFPQLVFTDKEINGFSKGESLVK